MDRHGLSQTNCFRRTYDAASISSRRCLMDSSSACRISALLLSDSRSPAGSVCTGCIPYPPNRIHLGNPVAWNQVRHPWPPAPKQRPRHPRPRLKPFPGEVFAFPGISKPAQYPALLPVMAPIPRGPVLSPRGIAFSFLILRGPLGAPRSSLSVFVPPVLRWSAALQPMP